MCTDMCIDVCIDICTSTCIEAVNSSDGQHCGDGGRLWQCWSDVGAMSARTTKSQAGRPDSRRPMTTQSSHQPQTKKSPTFVVLVDMAPTSDQHCHGLFFCHRWNAHFELLWLGMCVDMRREMCVEMWLHVYRHANRHVCRRVCRHLWGHVRRHGCRHLFRHVLRHACRHACRHVLRHVCTHACRHVCRYVCGHVCRHVWRHGCRHVRKNQAGVQAGV